MAFYEDKIILVTGGGSLGRELVVRLLEREAREVRIFDNSEQQLHKCELAFRRHPEVAYIQGDVGDPDAVEMALPGAKLVIHTAACKFVNYVEYHPFQALRTNVEGTQNLVKAIFRIPSVMKAINISSDKACNPVSIYGHTKALGERLFTWADRVSRKAFCSVRFPNFFGCEGSVIETWTRQGEAGLPITVTDKGMTRHFITLRAAAEFTLEALKAAKGGEVFVPANVPERSIMDLAEEYAEKYGVSMEFIGRRLGERLHEVMITEEEKEMATRDSLFWVIETGKEYLGTPHYLYDTYREG